MRESDFLSEMFKTLKLSGKFQRFSAIDGSI